VLGLVLLELFEPRLPVFVLALGALRRPDEAQVVELGDPLRGERALLLVPLRGLLVEQLVLLPRVVYELAQAGILLVPDRDEQVAVVLGQ